MLNKFACRDLTHVHTSRNEQQSKSVIAGSPDADVAGHRITLSRAIGLGRNLLIRSIAQDPTFIMKLIDLPELFYVGCFASLFLLHPLFDGQTALLHEEGESALSRPPL